MKFPCLIFYVSLLAQDWSAVAGGVESVGGRQQGAEGGGQGQAVLVRTLRCCAEQRWGLSKSSRVREQPEAVW